MNLNEIITYAPNVTVCITANDVVGTVKIMDVDESGTESGLVLAVIPEGAVSQTPVTLQSGSIKAVAESGATVGSIQVLRPVAPFKTASAIASNGGGIDANGNLTVEGITTTKQVLNALGGILCPKPTIGENAVNRDYVNIFSRMFDVPYCVIEKPTRGITDYGGGNLVLDQWVGEDDCFNFIHKTHFVWMGSHWYCNSFSLIIPNNSALDGGRFRKYIICNRPLTKTVPASINDNEQEDPSLWGLYMHIIDTNYMHNGYDSWDYYVKILSPSGVIIEKKGNTGRLWDGGIVARRFCGTAIVSNFNRSKSAIYLIFEDIILSKTVAIKIMAIEHTVDLPEFLLYQKMHVAANKSIQAFIQNPRFTIDSSNIDYFDAIAVRDLTI